MVPVGNSGRGALRSDLHRRAAEAGVGALECAELLELLAGPRSRPLAERDLVDLTRSTSEELRQWSQLGRRESTRLAAAFELSRRIAVARGRERPFVRSAAEVHELCGPELRALEREVFLVLVLDGKHRMRARELVSAGSLTSSIVHPREVFRPALRAAAAAVICVHNHPSGDPEPSAEDIEVTKRLLQAGKLLGVPLLDHVVIGDQRFVSLRDRVAF